MLALNVHRRHLTAEQKREVIAKLIEAQPEKSDRQIAKQVKRDHKTVGAVRAQMEDVGRVPHVETRTDTKGRKQPIKKNRRATANSRDDKQRAQDFGRRTAKFATDIAEQFEAFLETKPTLTDGALQSLLGIFNVCAEQFTALAEAVAEQIEGGE